MSDDEAKVVFWHWFVFALFLVGKIIFFGGALLNASR